MAKIDDIKTSLDALNGSVDGLIALADSLVTQIKALQGQSSPVTDAQLQGLLDTITAEKAKVDAALAADKA